MPVTIRRVDLISRWAIAPVLGSENTRKTTEASAFRLMNGTKSTRCIADGMEQPSLPGLNRKLGF
jgi:hypothetical protein